MNKRMKKIATKLFRLLGKYIVESEKCGKVLDEFLFIRDDRTGEILIFASNLDAVKKHVPFIKGVR